MRETKEALEHFSAISGLEVYTEKSNAYHSKASAELSLIHSVLGFCVKTLPLTYLGLPISGKRKSMGQCHKLLQPLEGNLPSILVGKEDA